MSNLRAFEQSLRGGSLVAGNNSRNKFSPLQHRSCKGKVHGTGNYNTTPENKSVTPTSGHKHSPSISSYDGMSDTEDNDSMIEGIKNKVTKLNNIATRATNLKSAKIHQNGSIPIKTVENNGTSKKTKNKRRESLRKVLEQRPPFKSTVSPNSLANGGRHLKNGVIVIEAINHNSDINSSEESIKDNLIKNNNKPITKPKIVRKVSPKINSHPPPIHPPLNRKLSTNNSFRNKLNKRKFSNNVQTISWTQLMDLAMNQKVNCSWSYDSLLRDFNLLKANGIVSEDQGDCMEVSNKCIFLKLL